MTDDNDDKMMDPNAVDEMAEDAHEDEDEEIGAEHEEESM